jgi:hypothetical protein
MDVSSKLHISPAGLGSGLPVQTYQAAAAEASNARQHVSEFKAYIDSLSLGAEELPIRPVAQPSGSRGEVMSPDPGNPHSRKSASPIVRRSVTSNSASAFTARIAQEPKRKPLVSPSKTSNSANPGLTAHNQSKSFQITSPEQQSNSATQSTSKPAYRALATREGEESDIMTGQYQVEWRGEGGLYKCFRNNQLVTEQRNFPLNVWVYSAQGWMDQGARKWVIRRSASEGYEFRQNPEVPS